MTDKQTKKLVIATFRLSTYSETFIHQHISALPFSVKTLSGDNLTQTPEGVDLVRRTIPQRVYHKIKGILSGFDQESYRDTSIARYLKTEDTNVVLAEYGTTAVKIMKACQIANVPLVVHFHGYDAHNHSIVAPLRTAYAELFESASAVIGVSHDMCNQLEKLGARPETIHYVPYYVKPDTFLPVSPGNNPPEFVAVGRFVEKKAPHLTVLAFREVLNTVPEARLHMLGDGELLGATKSLARSIGITHAITFHGAVGHEAVAGALKRARCFVQHSVRAENGDSEGTPVAILEAQASGLPVVATRHTGIKDVVLEKETGFLVDEFDIQSMSDYMRILALDPELAAALGQNAIKRIREHFGARQTIDKLAKIIHRSAR